LVEARLTLGEMLGENVLIEFDPEAGFLGGLNVPILDKRIVACKQVVPPIDSEGVVFAYSEVRACVLD
jgi:hypothetical protein